MQANLGLMKVLVAKSQAESLQTHLKSMVEGLLKWQDDTKNHFKAKVCVSLSYLFCLGLVSQDNFSLQRASLLFHVPLGIYPVASIMKLVILYPASFNMALKGIGLHSSTIVFFMEVLNSVCAPVGVILTIALVRLGLPLYFKQIEGIGFSDVPS